MLCVSDGKYARPYGQIKIPTSLSLPAIWKSARLSVIISENVSGRMYLSDSQVTGLCEAGKNSVKLALFP